MISRILRDSDVMNRGDWRSLDVLISATARSLKSDAYWITKVDLQLSTDINILAEEP